MKERDVVFTQNTAKRSDTNGGCSAEVTVTQSYTHSNTDYYRV